MEKELHLAELHSPHGVKNGEHYCRRWVAVKLLSKMATSNEPIMVDIQRSSYWKTQNEYLLLSIAFSSESDNAVKASVNIGILLNDKVKEKIKFWKDPVINWRQVSATCETCGIPDCAERVAPPISYDEKARIRRIHSVIEEISQH